MTDRRDLLRLTAVLVALLVLAGAIMLATQGGGSDDDDGGRATSAQTLDGIVMEVSATKLVLQPAGRERVTFEIRPVDQPTFDVFHLQQHAADGLQTRVTYLEEDGRLYALRADDAPQANVG